MSTCGAAAAAAGLSNWSQPAHQSSSRCRRAPAQSYLDFIDAHDASSTVLHEFVDAQDAVWTILRQFVDVQDAVLTILRQFVDALVKVWVIWYIIVWAPSIGRWS